MTSRLCVTFLVLCGLRVLAGVADNKSACQNAARHARIAALLLNALATAIGIVRALSRA